MTAKLGFLGRTLPLTALFFVAGCGAMEGSWPNLAGDPPAEPVALLDPVRLPEPRTEMAAISPQEARALLEALPQRQNVLSQQLHDARSRYESAKAAIGTQQPERLQGVDYRTAQFALSRLSALETDLTQLSRQAQSAWATLSPQDRSNDIQSLIDSLAQTAQALTAYLIEERSALTQMAP